LVNAIATAVDARRQAEAGAELAQLQTNASAKAINEHQLARQLAIAATEQSKTQQRKATLATTEADRQSEIAIRNRVSLERVRAETEGLSFQRQLDIESGYTSSAMQIAASGDFQAALTWANLSLDHAKVIGRDPIILSEHQIRIMAIRSHLPKLSTYLQFSNTPLLTSYSTTTKAMAVVPLRAAPQETAVRTFQGNALKKLHSIKEVGLSVTAMVFSPNGQYLVIAGTADVKPISSELLLISMSDASMERITLSISGEVVALAATNNKIAIGTSEGALNTYVFPDMKPHRSVMAHLDPITTISLSPDLLTAATGSDDRTAKLWELDTLTPSSNAMLHTSAVIDIHFSKTRKEVVTTAQSGHSYSWDTSQFSPSPKMAGGPDPSRSLSVSAMAHHPTGLLFALGTENGAVRIFNAPGSDFIEPLLLGSRITVLSFSKDARLLLIGTAEGTLSVYDFSRRQLIYDGVSHLGAISSLSLSANNQYVTVVTTAGQILSWDLAQTSLAPTELVAGIKPSFLRSNASQSAVVFVTNNTFLHELNTETQFRQLGAELDFQVPIEDVVLSAYTEHGFVITQRVAHPITTSPLKMSGSQIEFAGQIIDVAIADDGYYALSSADRTITIGKFNDESHKSRITAHKLPARFVRFTDDSSKLLTIGPGADNLGNRLVQVISTPNNTVLKRTVVPFDIDSVAATLLANSNDLVVATSQGDVWKLDVNTLIVSRFDDSGFSTRSIVSHGASDFILARDDSIVELVSAGSAPTYRSDFQTIHTSYHEGYDWLLRANDTQFSIQSAKTARQISPPITVPGEIRETLLVVKDERPLVLIAGDDVVYQYSVEANADPTSSTLLKLLSGSRLDHQKHQVKLSHSDIANMLSDNEFRSIYTSNPLTWLRRYSTTITPAQWRPHIDNLLLRLSKLSHTADTAARKFVIADLIYALLSSGDHKGAFDLLLSNDDIKSTYRAVVLAAWIEDLKLYDQALRQLLKNANPRVPQHFVYLLTGLSLATHDFPVESLMKSLDRLPDRLAGNSLVQRGQLSLAIFRNDKLMALEVLANSPKSGLPLPLKIYFEMARNWTSPKGVTSELLTQFRHQLEVLPAIKSGNPGKNWDERCLLDILFRRLQLSNTAPQNGAVNEQD
ncbi:MAG: hypothetical protein HOB73_04185, partial [Planctomycetaceae bacterium]|nr:hypothetical protein [Planctomycetaceae bacterium]